MSNTIPNSFEYEVPEFEVPVTEEETTVAKKNVFYRVLCGLLVALSVAFVFLLKVGVVVGTKLETMTLFSAIKDLFASSTDKLFGFLPSLVLQPEGGALICETTALALYFLLVTVLVSAVFGIIGIFCAKKSPAFLRVVSLLLSIGFLGYALSVFAFTYNTTLPAEGVFDLFVLIFGAVNAVIFAVLAFVRAGKKAIMSLVHLLLSVIATGAVAYGLIKYGVIYYDCLESSIGYDTVCIILASVIAFVLVSGAIRFQTKKGLVFDMVRYALQIVATGVTLYCAIASDFSDATMLIVAIVATVLSILQLVICILQKKAGKAKESEEETEEVEETEEFAQPQGLPSYLPPVLPEEPAVEAPVAIPQAMPAPVASPVQTATSEFVIEEYAEAMPYDGGPVEGVEIAKEVNPTVCVAPQGRVQTAGYDFYNCKSFDPFIAILNNEERNQFTELFILKYKGVMPEIPDYVVGGDNKAFFRKLFIYLGQYRDRIPDGLLSKMYQFAIKM